jgi:hypothetical protein
MRMDTLVLLILLVAVAAIATFLLASLRRGGGSPVPTADQSRTQNAYPYEGMIIGFEEIGNGRDNHGPFRAVDFAFEIQPPGEAPYQTRTSWKVYASSDQGLQLGRTVAIKVDLDDPLIIYPGMPGVEYHWARAQAVQRVQALQRR